MKKLFISCPMRGRTEENIKKSMEKMHKIAEIVFDQELEVIPSYIEHDPPEATDLRIWYLGQSIQKMADADFYIGVRWTNGFAGCGVENEVADCYGLKRTYVNMEELMPDVADIIRKNCCPASC
jgi:hypothetical protein